MTDITELAQREKFEAWARSQKLGLSYGDCGYVFSSTEMAWRAWMTSSAELVEALEKAQTINAAAEKLVRCKGRYHSEQNYRALAALFGVTTPDLPPINSDNANAVKLPRAYNMLLRQKFFEHYSSQEAFKVKDMLEALTAAGIEWEFE
ncbi:hypothetical protein U4P09_20635 [Klebsiella quasipneumoniae subsp. similipneumoniae]